MKLSGKLSGNFSETMENRSKEWAAVGRVAALIEVPIELAWWYYNEWGTANFGVKGGETYRITPTNKDALAFPNADGHTILRTLVNHPGIPAEHMVQKALPAIRLVLQHEIHNALVQSGLSPVETKAILLDNVMVEAKRLIVESFAQYLDKGRKGGTPKLKGKTAAVTFADNAQIIDKTE